MTAKRKCACLVDIDLNVKMQLKEVNSNAKQKDIACKFVINVSTVSKLVKNCEKIEKDFHSLLSSAGCKRMCSSAYADVGDAWLKWFKQTCIGRPY